MIKDITDRLERDILSAMTLDVNYLQIGISELLIKHFKSNENKVWFNALIESSKMKEHSLMNVIDLIVRDQFYSLEEISLYIMNSTDDLVSVYSTDANIELLKKKYKQRTLSELFYTSYKALADDNQNPDDIAYNVQKTILELNQETNKGGLTQINQALEHVYEDCFNGYENPDFTPDNIRLTKFSSIDEKLIIKAQDLIVIGARPAMGKTSFLLNVGLNLVEQDYTIAMFSLEMSKEQITKRLVSLKSDISTSRMKFLKDLELKQIDNAIKKLKDIGFYIDDRSAITTDYLRNEVRKLKLEAESKGKKLGAILVDYIQLMRGVNNKGNREQEIAEITRELKNIARDEDVPVITLAQLSRSVEQRQNKRPQLSDLRESGEIEQSADVIAFLYRDEYYNKETTDKKIAELIIGKYREGETCTIKLFFEASLTKFGSLERG